MKRILVLLIVLVLVPVVIRAQASAPVTSDREQWVNLPGSPVLLTKSYKNRLLIAINKSKETLVKLRFGWVSQHNDEISIRLAVKPRETVVKSGTFVGVVWIDDLEACAAEKNLRLAVVEVNFEDGSSWKTEYMKAAPTCEIDCPRLAEPPSPQ